MANDKKLNKEKFEEVNNQIKEIITAYQQDRFLIPIERKLASLHDRLKKSLGNFIEKDENINDLITKMEKSLNFILSGQIDYVTDTDIDDMNYHMLLWKLHQYLIKNIYPTLE
ncbi:MAG TPA: hypothetical protein PKW55_00285 [Spirochaetota bacterium]|nr:hypothetical protein [Spirochaetota bacterium]HOM37795.1 hypothetical protein [Spirochaetota bacterium]HPQ49328.1 hypothetical protein [Spirochaetota bacterium]